MKTTIIQVDELQPFMEFHKLERELQVLMQYFVDDQEVQLKKLERIKTVARRLADMKKQKQGWAMTMDPGTREAVKRAGFMGIGLTEQGIKSCVKKGEATTNGN